MPCCPLVRWTCRAWFIRAVQRLVWVAYVVTTAAHAASPVWQLGRFDDSSAEFHAWIHPSTGERQIDYTLESRTVVVRPGTPGAESLWRAYQPGSANGGTGFRPHPAVLEFELPEVPRSMMRLTVGLLSYSARLPVLQLEVNGKRGWYHQQPRLASTAGDSAVFFQPHYSTGRITCELRADLFRAGTNRLVLTAIDVPGEREDVRPSGFPLPGNSGLIYDALALEALTADEARGVPSAVIRVEPTPFFRDREGRLMNEVTVTVRSPYPMGRTSVALQVEGTPAGTVFETPHEFGEQQVTVDLPAWEGVARGTARATGSFGECEESLRMRAARRWQIWVVPHEHLDVGYTDDASKIAELHSRVLDDAEALTRRHPGFAFTVDGAWVLEEFLAGRTPEAQQRVLEALRQRRLFVPAVHGSLFTGSASLEGLVRTLYPSRALSKRYGFPFDVAMVTDVPSYSWSLASVLSAAGIRYFVGASDAYRGPFLLRNALHEIGPHLWEGPDGGRVVTWYSRHYHQFSSLFGLPPRMTLGRESLPRFLQAYEHEAYPASDVILYGSQVENVVVQPEQAAFAQAWNAVHLYPRLRYGGFAEALDAISAQQPTQRVVRGDGGPYWEDGLAANARITALARENARRLLSAEKAASLASLAIPSFAPDRESLVAAWRHSLLIDEHTWHADCSVRDPESEQARRQGAEKDANATDARRRLERVLKRSLSALADAAPVPPGSLLVFNPSSWARDGFMEVEVGRGMIPVDAATGMLTPHEVLRVGKVYHRLRIALPEVAALGARVLPLRPSPIPSREQPLPDPNLLESPHYRVRIDPQRGGIVSLHDKALNRELVGDGGGTAFGQWIYVTGGDELPNRLVQYSTVSPVPELTLHRATVEGPVQAVATPLGVRARWRSHAVRCPRIETEVFLPTSRREVHLSVRVRKEATLDKEAAYVAFPLALGEPVFRYATQNGWVNPARDLLPGACHEWFTVADWISVAGRDAEVTMVPLDAPLVTLGDIVRGTWPETFGQRAPVVFSYVMSNYTPEGYAAQQGGDFEFRYVLRSGASFDSGASARFGAAQITPFEGNEVTRADKLRTGEGPTWPLEGAQVDPDTVQVSTWKPAEDGRGWVVRLVETAGVVAEASVRMPGGGRWRINRCSAVEDDLEEAREVEGAWRVRLRAFGIETVRVQAVPR